MSRIQTLSFLAAALVAVPAALAAQDVSTSTALFTWSGHVASGNTLEIKHFNGPIEVREGTGDQVDFRAERRARRSSELTFEVQNGARGVTICSVWRGRSACDRSGGWDWDDGPPSSRIIVTLPKGVKLDASTGNGDVSVDKASNDVDVHSGNGDIRITMTAGRVNVATGNGVLEIAGATGPVHASTGNGRVDVETATGPVEVSTGNGDIDVRMNALSAASDMTYSTGNGSISVALPGNFNGEIDANTGNGEFRSDFPIQVVGRLNPHHVRGTIGSGGGQLIRMNTGSGRLELRKSS
jgi:DUF4097 and DUF4098 domain-containing protein YvlB